MDDFFWRKKKCVGARISGGGPCGVHEAGGAPHMVGPPGVFSVPIILKYSGKKSYFISRAFGELLFSGYFLLQG